MPRILIVDDDPGFRGLLREHLLAEWPKAEISDYDPVAAGPLPDGFDGAGHDIVLLDYLLGTESGLEYLRRFRKIGHFPPVIMLTGEGSERLAVDAIKLGAMDYIVKQDMSHAGLVKSMREALDTEGADDLLAKSEPVFKAVPERHVQIKGLRVVRKLGEGSMSAVYLAERVRNGEQVVLKIFDQTKGEKYGDGMERFSQEYDIVRGLNHPGIVRIYEQGFTDDYAYIAMEFFPAGSLRERMRTALPPDESLRYLIGIANGLEAVHAAGIIHRDLKPANVMFREDGTPVLIDFGIAKSLNDTSSMTRAGLAVGTPHYMSPEQVDGRNPDARSDLYSLGAIFFQMLTGYVPYSAATAMAVMYKHKHAPLPELRPALSVFQGIFDRFLAKAPEDRFQSVGEMRKALSALPKL